MDRALAERRRDARFGQPVIGHLTATLRPGNVVSLVDLGAGGALVHSARPLRPGSRVSLQLASTTETRRIAAFVLRCAVAALDGTLGVTYGGALKFESRCEVPWEARTRQG